MPVAVRRMLCLAALCLALCPIADPAVVCLAVPSAPAHPAQARSPQTRPAQAGYAQPRSAQARRVQSRSGGGNPAEVHPPESDQAETRPAGARSTDSRPAQDPAAERAPRAPRPTTARFPTEDNLLIAGAYTPPPAGKAERAPMVILLHMYGSDHTAFDPLVPYLHAAGFAVLAIDLRGHGGSVGPPEMGLAERVARHDKKLFQAMDRDVEAAYRWLARQPGTDPARFVLVGASVGCSVALKYAARDRSVDGVVCLTPGTGYVGIDSFSDARKYSRRPLLLLASEDERTASDELGRMVPEAVVQIVSAKGGGELMALHGTRMFGQAPHIEQTITAFVLKAAGPPGTDPVLASIQGEVYHPSGGSTRQISPENVRWFSSAEEAESRGLRPPKNRATRGRGRSSSAGGEPFPGSDAPLGRRR